MYTDPNQGSSEKDAKVYKENDWRGLMSIIVCESWSAFGVLQPMPVMPVQGEVWFVKAMLPQDWTRWAPGFARAHTDGGP